MSLSGQVKIREETVCLFLPRTPVPPAPPAGASVHHALRAGTICYELLSNSKIGCKWYTDCRSAGFASVARRHEFFQNIRANL